MIINAEAKCDIGKVRSNNEDMILFLNSPLRNTSQACRCEQLLHEACAVFAVSDGMGGANGGEIASERTILSLMAHINELMVMQASFEQMVDGLRAWQQGIHAALLQEADVRLELKGMGCTLVGLFFVHGHMFHVNCGDSRLYRFRDGTLKQLTRDHSLREAMGDDNVVGNIITNSIGGAKQTYMDIVEITDSVLNGDCYMLCSDGLTDMLTDQEISEIFGLPDASVEKLVDAANGRGGADNISVCVIRVVHIDENDHLHRRQETFVEQTLEVETFTRSEPESRPFSVEEQICEEAVQVPTLPPPPPIDMAVVLKQIKTKLVLNQLVFSRKQEDLLQMFVEQLSESYPSIGESKTLAEMAFNALLANALCRHLQTGVGLWGLSAKKLAALDDLDFVLRTY